VRSLPKARHYTVELESAPVGAALTEAALDAFTVAVSADRKLVDPTPGADLDLGRLELRTGVGASGVSNAFAIVEVAFLRAAEKVGLTVVVTEACVWIDEEVDSAA
jgi:hypothetical protein